MNQLIVQEQLNIQNAELARLKRNAKRRERYATKSSDYDKAKTKAYYQENRDFLLTRTDCGCGGVYSKINKSTHMKSKGHCKWLLWTNQLVGDQQ
jgi:hypothetical protein